MSDTKKAAEFVESYRKKGYPDQRIKIIASVRAEPLRGEILALLDDSGAPAKKLPGKNAPQKPSPKKDAADPMKAISDYVVSATQTKPQAETVKTPASKPKPAAPKAPVAAPDKAPKTVWKNNPEIIALRTEAETFRKAKNSLQAERDTLRTSLEELRASAADAKIAEQHAQELENSLQAQARERTALSEELADATRDMEAMRHSTANMEEETRQKNARILELESAGNQSGRRLSALQREVEANEVAVGELEERLSARETELENMRENFDREVADLRERADNEVWLIRHRLDSMRRMAVMGGSIAAAMMLFLAWYAFVPTQTAQPVSQSNTPGVVKDGGDPRSVPPDNTRVVVNPTTTTLAIVRGTPTTTRNIVALDIPANRSPKTIEYIVQKGDSFWRISEKVLGKGSEHQRIMRENPGVSAADLKPGMKLKITIPPPNE